MHVKKLVFLTTLTPLHAGSEGDANSPVDQPVQREKHTAFPVIYGSSLKGVFRSAFERKKQNKEEVKRIFGSQDKRGSITLTDARVILFPVRILEGVFVWVTSPFVLQRFLRDARLIAGSNTPSFEAPPFSSEEEAYSASREGTVFLEEYKLTLQKNETLKELITFLSETIGEEPFTQKRLERDLLIVHDTLFKTLVQRGTEILPRIHINPETGTVQEGAFWMEEYVPPETLFYTILLSEDEGILGTLENTLPQTLQFGGNETIGKGIMHLSFVNPQENERGGTYEQ